MKFRCLHCRVGVCVCVCVRHLCKAPVLGDGRVPVVQRAWHPADGHPASAVGGHARRLRSGRAAAGAPAAALAARPEPARQNTLHYSSTLI